MSHADRLSSAGTKEVRARAEGRRSLSLPITEQLLTATVMTKGQMDIPHSARNLVASHDLHSPQQVLLDSLFIIILGELSDFIYQEIFLVKISHIIDFATIGLLVAFFYFGFSRLVLGRQIAVLTNRFDRLRNAALVWSLSFAALLFILFALKVGSSVSRGAVFTFYFLGLAAVGLWRVYSPLMILHFVQGKNLAERDCIIVGNFGARTVDELAAEFATSSHAVPSIIRFQADCNKQTWPLEHKRLIEGVIKFAHKLRHGEIYLCASGVTSDRLASIQRSLSLLPRAIYIVPDADVAALVRKKTFTVGAYIAIEMRREPLNVFQRLVKRLFDALAAFLAIILLSPFLCVVALLIKLGSPGPVFFLQTRNGYRGKPFKIVKFRSMDVQEDGPVVPQASRDDPRVTRVGRILRKSSIDELPQLFNVLIGQMSLVGPRPHAQAHDELYAKAIENYEIRQHVKPGITGWAQVNGLRGETAELDQMYRRIEHDLWYAVNASLLLDAEILVRTIFEVFRQRNAY